MEDLLGPRAWSDHESCRGFAAELLSAFPSCFGLSPSALQQLGWAGKAGRSAVWGGAAGGDTGMGTGQPGSGSEARICRYSGVEAQQRVHQTFMKCLAKFVNNVAARDNSRLLLRVLAMACSMPAGRLVVAQQLEGLLNSTAHSRAAQTVLELLVTHMGEGGAGVDSEGDGKGEGEEEDRTDEDVVPVLFQLRLRPQHAGIIPQVASNIVSRHPHFTPLVVQLVSIQDIRDHTPHAMKCLSAVMEAAPGDWVAQAVAQALQALSKNGETKSHMRPFMRRMMKACSTVYRDWPNVWRYLMQPPEEAAGWSEVVREQWLLEVIQMGTFMQLLLVGGVPSPSPDGASEIPENWALETVAQFAAEAAEWCQAILCDLLPDISSENLLLALRRLLFLEGRHAYFTAGEGVPEHESEAFNRLATGLPTSEDTLTRVVLMGLTDTPLSGEDALDLAEALLCRSAAAWATQPQSGRSVSRVSNPEVLSALTRLAVYSPPAPPLSDIEPEEPIEPLARAPLYWKVSLVLVLVCALNFEDFGSVMLEELPVVSALMEALAMSRPCYPRAYELQTEGLSVDPELQHAADDREASLRLQKYLNKCGSLWCPPPEGLMRLNFTLVRAAPSEVLDKLMMMDRQYYLGKHIRSLSNPDILLNILKAMQQEEAWDWLVPILENEPAASAKLPPEWSGTLLLELFDRLHSCEEARKNPTTTITLIEHTSKRLRNVLETVDCVDCSLLMSLKPIVDALLGESARHRDLAHSSLNAILSASESISTMPDDGVEAATQCNRLAWLERLVQRASPGHGYMLTTVLPSIVSSMVFFESDPNFLDEYLRLLDSEMRGATSSDVPDGSFPLVVATFLLCRPLTVELLFQERPGTVAIILAAILRGLDSKIRVDLTSTQLSAVMSLYSQWFPRAPQPGARATVSGFGPEFECLHLNLAAAVKAIQVLGQVVNHSSPEEMVTGTKHLTDRVFAGFIGPQPPNGPQRTLSVGGGPPENLLSADDLEQLARGHNMKLCQLAMSLMPRGDVVKFVRRYVDMSKVSITCLLEKLDEMSDADILHTAVAESGLLCKEFLEALAALRRRCLDEQLLQKEGGAGYRAEMAVKRSPRSSESPQGRLKRNAGIMEVDSSGTTLVERDTLVSMSHLGAFVDSLFVPAPHEFSEPVLAVELELHSQALAMQMLSAGSDSSPEAMGLRFVTSVASSLKERALKCSKTSLGSSDSLFADSPRLASVLQALTSCDPALPAKYREELMQLCLFVSKQSGGDMRIAAARVANAFVDGGFYSVVQSSLLDGASPNISTEELAGEFVRADLQLLKDLGLGDLNTSRVPKTVILEALLLAAIDEKFHPGSDADDATLFELRVSTLFECLEKADPGMEFCLDGFISCLQSALSSSSSIRSCRAPPPSSTLECIVKSLASPLRALMHEASWARREIVVETILKKCADFDLEHLVAATTNEVEVRCAAAAAGIVLDTVSCFVRHPATWASWQERGSHPRKSILSQYYKFGPGASSCITKLILFESFYNDVSQLRRFPLLLTLFFAEEGVARCAAQVLGSTSTAKVDTQGAPPLVNTSTALLDRLYAVAPFKTSHLVSRGEEFVRVDLQSSEVDAVFHRLVRKVCLSTGPDCVAAVESCSALGRILPFHFSKHLPALAAFLSPLSEAVSVASDEDMTQICDMFSLIFDLLQALGGRLWTTPSDYTEHCILSCMEVIQSLMGVMLSAERNTSKYLSPLCERFCNYVREQSADSEAFRGAAAATIVPKLRDLQQVHPNVVGLASLENYLAGADHTESAAAPAPVTGDIIAAICSFSATMSLRTSSAEVEENDAFLTADSLADTGGLNVSCLDCISSLDDILSSDPKVIQNPELQQALLRFTQSADEDLWREASYRLILRFLTNNIVTSVRNHSIIVREFQDKMVKNVLDSLAGSFGLPVRTTALAFLPGMCRLSTERTPELISWALLFCGEQSLGSLLAVSQ